MIPKLKALYIQQYLQWKDGEVWLNNQLQARSEERDVMLLLSDIYRQTGITYPKFFKMDLLSKLAYLAASIVLPPIIEEDKKNIAVVLSTTSGCLDVDKRFDESRAAIASPGLFVYTLPNIMLGEICIANGFKGEQMCTISDTPDADYTDFYVKDLLQNRGTEAVLCGHAEATQTGISAALIWVNKTPSTLPFDSKTLNTIFSKIR